MTATLDKAGGIISAAAEGGFVGGDRLPCGPAPAEGFGAFEPRPPRSIRSLSQLRAGVPDNLRNARVPERRDRAAARHRLETRQAETLVTAREQQAPRRRVKVGELAVHYVAEPMSGAHVPRRLGTRLPGDHQLQVLGRRARGMPRAQQRVRVFPRVKGAHEEQVSRFETPAPAHPIWRARPWLELVAGGFGNDPDALAVDPAESDSVVRRRLRHG